MIYDAPAPERTDPDTFTVRADLIGLRKPKAVLRAKRVAASAS